MDQQIEPRLAELLRDERFEAALTVAVEAYGPELYGYLVTVMGNEHAAADVFSQSLEDCWRGLPSFQGGCSVRTWLYVLARHAASRYGRSPWNRAVRTGDSQLEAVVAEARSQTARWLKSEVKDRWHELRSALDPDDQTLLVLRVDRDLGWTDVARVLMGSPHPDAAALARESARLRKRFQLLKDELRDRARAAGLLEDEDG